ncbi:hypothetical protein RRG08_038866 [Elysia crispata]|uniref:Uncharacterized protein n=1 Tax=Elysia crispata TaxID=231223 RepID=A0AAE1D3X9_9GAST|nr:hypothetical protein RRG08_038866 [Elysia crispata]
MTNETVRYENNNRKTDGEDWLGALPLGNHGIVGALKINWSRGLPVGSVHCKTSGYGGADLICVVILSDGLRGGQLIIERGICTFTDQYVQTHFTVFIHNSTSFNNDQDLKKADQNLSSEIDQDADVISTGD